MLNPKAKKYRMGMNHGEICPATFATDSPSCRNPKICAEKMKTGSNIVAVARLMIQDLCK
uniref:Uncharacterized protein n=1 Tax=Rhizophora mucronata TaxID=61149 RepID=A0A2P2PTD6_RHIMU